MGDPRRRRHLRRGLHLLSYVDSLLAFYGAFIVTALAAACAASFRSTSH